MKIGLILHGGKSGSDKISEKFQNIFGNENVIARKTSRHGEAELLAMELAEMNLSAIVVCGGDGSLNPAVNGIMNSTNPNVPIAVWPCGTANDFIKSVSVPST
ncbi:MAG: diacylglycerol/lipid kinase family protein, partial [Bacteroidota bacterium]